MASMKILMQNENVFFLILGYSVHIIMVNHNNLGATALNNEVELFRLPYEDDDFLSYIDNEELPTSILDLLERAWPDLFYR